MLDTVLLDIDGTLTFQGQAIAGAHQALLAIERLGLRFKLLSNISERLPQVIAAELRALSFERITHEHIHTSTLAAAQLVAGSTASYTDLLIPNAVRPLFPAARLNRQTPDYLIVGGLSAGIDSDVINQAFRHLKAGARLVAMHKNPYSLTPSGPTLDSGAYIAALEYAANTQALICGKPSPTFFTTALADLGSSAASTLVVGDDLTTDIAGGHAAGLLTVQVGTGKGGEATNHGQPAHHSVASVAALPQLLEALLQR